MLDFLMEWWVGRESMKVGPTHPLHGLRYFSRLELEEKVGQLSRQLLEEQRKSDEMQIELYRLRAIREFEAREL